MTASGVRSFFQRPLRFLQRSWRGIALGIAKWLTFLLMVVMAIELWANAGSGSPDCVFALFLFAVFAVALAYWIVVSPRVRLRIPGFDANADQQEAGGADGGARPNARNAGDRHVARLSRKRQHDVVKTVQVSRLDTKAAGLVVANGAPVPVLRAQAAVTLTHEPEGGDASEDPMPTFVNGTEFAIPARSERPVAVASTFDHVGIFMLRCAGVRIYGLLGLLTRVCGPSGQWRVRVVPNIYRLTRGIPQKRKVSQSDLGIPDTPSDALDYDRVREYRPGDPLKTIHWNLVAHGTGDLYTKLFETATVSGVTLLVDPFGPQVSAGSPDAVYHMHDTMLEGAFSLVEHARQSDLACRLRFFDRSGKLVETGWHGMATLGWFVETAQRPAETQLARERGASAIRSLRNGRLGYTIYATCRLSDESVTELIACHHLGVPLLVVHALPARSARENASQRAYDNRLREASIDVIDLMDGSQIVREVAAQ